MDTKEFDFSGFVEERKRVAFGRDDTVRYAFSGDLAMLRAFARFRPVELAAASVVRTSQELMRNQMLGTMVRVGPKQFKSIHDIAVHCANVLTVPVPTVYIKNSPFPRAFSLSLLTARLAALAKATF